MITLNYLFKIMHKNDLSEEDKQLMPILIYIMLQVSLLEGIIEGLLFAAITAKLIDNIISLF